MDDFTLRVELKQYLCEQTGATPLKSINIYYGMCCIPDAVTSFLNFFPPLHTLNIFFPPSLLPLHFHIFILCHHLYTEPSRRFLAARLLCCCGCCVPWFEFQNISDWLPILTADDVMETLLSSALKNWRMIYNEMQPLTFFRGM